MAYLPMNNWRTDNPRDQSLFGTYGSYPGSHVTQSGPDQVRYIALSHGSNFLKGVNLEGADFGVITPGPPNSGAWGYSTEWRRVPPAIPGYWTNYAEPGLYPDPSGTLNINDGYRRQFSQQIAAGPSHVASSEGPRFGTRNTTKYTYYDGTAPSTQGYEPYNTPESNNSVQGQTGGGVTHQREMGSILTTVFPNADALPANQIKSRGNWQYNPPVYCQTLTESRRNGVPEQMGGVTRFVYRGKSSSYVYNYGQPYYQGSEAAQRGLIRSFSTSVNSSNQRNPS